MHLSKVQEALEAELPIFEAVVIEQGILRNLVICLFA